MSDRYGFDFNNDGKVSFTESHMTYHTERETARKNSLYDSLKRNPTRSTTQSNNKNNPDSSKDGNGFVYFILFLTAIGFIYLIVSILKLVTG